MKRDENAKLDLRRSDTQRQGQEQTHARENESVTCFQNEQEEKVKLVRTLMRGSFEDGCRPVTSFHRRGVRFPLTLYLQKTSYYKHERNSILRDSYIYMRAQTHAHERTHGMNAEC